MKTTCLAVEKFPPFSEQLTCKIGEGQDYISYVSHISKKKKKKKLASKPLKNSMTVYYSTQSTTLNRAYKYHLEDWQKSGC